MGTERLTLTTTRDGAVRFEVHARPRARRSALAGLRLGGLVVQLAAPPVDGAANEALVALLADVLGVPKRDISLVAGATARAKVVEVRGLAEDEVSARLCQAIR
jgi:uncharacterized protein YggU (UPF0235/DUF167 family)